MLVFHFSFRCSTSHENVEANRIKDQPLRSVELATTARLLVPKGVNCNFLHRNLNQVRTCPGNKSEKRKTELRRFFFRRTVRRHAIKDSTSYRYRKGGGLNIDR